MRIDHLMLVKKSARTRELAHAVRLFGLSKIAASILLMVAALAPQATSADKDITLSRPVRPWEFLPVVGTRAGLLGNEVGRFEAWTYPLQILSDFRLTFHVGARSIPAESLARTLTVRPESATILYATDTFNISETLFVPIGESGAVIRLDITSREPVQVEASFRREFTLEWPAAIGGTYQSWDRELHAFVFGEEQKRFAAVVGAANAAISSEEYNNNYSSATEDSFELPAVTGATTQVIVIAGSTEGLAPAQEAYHRLTARYAELQEAAARYYRNYLAQTVTLRLPDQDLERAYDWSRISTLQGMVQNPYLGTGLIAGYGRSSHNQRPGFSWFFGRDSLWTSLALNAEGDFGSTRAALDFLTKFQRADGKVPHEISQSASLLPWFEKFPYGFASADATPLLIIAVDDYATRSGDVAFVQAKWDNIWRAYQFLRSTWDENGFPRNEGIGHGWVEGGPLLPVRTELYQSGLGLEALRALAHLAQLTGKQDLESELTQSFASKKPQLNDAFWIAEKNTYAFALDTSAKKVETDSVLSTVPMWFGLLNEDKAEQMIDRLAGEDHATDWGMRILSSRDSRYSPGGYHFGSVWPLFTGWASVGEYRYHRDLAAYANLRANALLGLDGSLGHFTEVLSGDYYQGLSTASPHQIWSAAMVVSPLLRGLLGLEGDARGHQLRLAPHVPAAWDSFDVRHFRVEDSRFDFEFHRASDGLTLTVRKTGNVPYDFEFSPAFSLRARVLGVELDGHAVPFQAEPNPEDQHAVVRIRLTGSQHTLRIRVRNDFGLGLAPNLPPLGASSRNLKITSSRWNAAKDQYTVEYSGHAGQRYEIDLRGGEQVNRVEGAELAGSGSERKIIIQMPQAPAGYVHSKLLIHFARTR